MNAREGCALQRAATLAARPDPAEALREFWRKFDSDPPDAAAFAAARRVCPDQLIREVITWRAELGPHGLDLLRGNLVDELRNRAVWEGQGA